jgi:hypothetical protein
VPLPVCTASGTQAFNKLLAPGHCRCAAVHCLWHFTSSRPLPLSRCRCALPVALTCKGQLEDARHRDIMIPSPSRAASADSESTVDAGGGGAAQLRLPAGQVLAWRRSVPQPRSESSHDVNRGRGPPGPTVDSDGGSVLDFGNLKSGTPGDPSESPVGRGRARHEGPGPAGRPGRNLPGRGPPRRGPHVYTTRLFTRKLPVAVILILGTLGPGPPGGVACRRSIGTLPFFSRSEGRSVLPVPVGLGRVPAASGRFCGTCP